MKSFKFFGLCVLLVAALASCKKYSYFQTNPNLPSNATPSLLLTDICYSIFYTDNTSASFASRHLTYYERGNSNVDYSWTAGSFDNYNVLRQVMQMDSLAKQLNQPQYLGLTKLFRAILFSQLTEQFGDIPYSQALQAISGNFKPAYDSQESIYEGLLGELDDANTLLDPSKGKINGDIIFNGDATEWKKFTNAFKLRLLIHLSKKESDGTLNVKQQFQNIVSNASKYPLLESNNDNAQLVFNTSAPDNYYPDYGYLSLATAVSMEKGFVEILKDRKDPRLFQIAEPVSGLPEGDFTSYAGVDAGLTVSDQQTASSDASRIKLRYHDDKVNEPWIFLGYAEQEFLIAEGISRGWASGNAKDHYENGILASMDFYGVATADANAYLSNTDVAFNTTDALTLIAYQKYIAMFMNSNWETFVEQRRTGIPTFDVGAGTYNNGKVPKRWLYPQTEYDYNADNLNTALQNQYSGNDDVNAVMWLIQ